MNPKTNSNNTGIRDQTTWVTTTPIITQIPTTRHIDLHTQASGTSTDHVLPRDQAKAPLSTKSGQANMGFPSQVPKFFCHFPFKNPLLILHNMVVAARVCRSPDSGQVQTLTNQTPLNANTSSYVARDLFEVS